MKDAFTANGLSAWEHYQQFGTAEGINPSADFDTVKYLEAKAAAMNALGGDKVWTAADVADAFAENGLNTTNCSATAVLKAKLPPATTPLRS